MLPSSDNDAFVMAFAPPTKKTCHRRPAGSLKAEKAAKEAKASALERAVAPYRTMAQLNALGIECLNDEEVPTPLANNYWAYTNERTSPPLAGTRPLPTPVPNTLTGFVWVITGVLESMERDEATAYIVACGGTVVKSVAQKTTHALIGSGCGQSKLKEISARALPKFSEPQLIALVSHIAKTNNGDDKNVATATAAPQAAPFDFLPPLPVVVTSRPQPHNPQNDPTLTSVETVMLKQSLPPPPRHEISDDEFEIDDDDDDNNSNSDDIDRM